MLRAVPLVRITFAALAAWERLPGEMLLQLLGGVVEAGWGRRSGRYS